MSHITLARATPRNRATHITPTRTHIAPDNRVTNITHERMAPPSQSNKYHTHAHHHHPTRQHIAHTRAPPPRSKETNTPQHRTPTTHITHTRRHTRAPPPSRATNIAHAAAQQSNKYHTTLRTSNEQHSHQCRPPEQTYTCSHFGNNGSFVIMADHVEHTNMARHGCRCKDLGAKLPPEAAMRMTYIQQGSTANKF